MVATHSTMLPLGTKAPDFTLSDVMTLKTISLATYQDKKALLIMFICGHCPYVKHVQYEIAKIGKDYQYKNVGIIAISSNDPERHEEDGIDGLKQMAHLLEFTFPLCFDKTQEVAKAYTASCTPDFYLFDNERKLVYRGQLDDSRPNSNIPVTGSNLRNAIEAVLNDKAVNNNQKPSIGCNIKWKQGNEPVYFQPH